MSRETSEPELESTVPPDYLAFARGFAASLREALEDDLVSFFVYGAALFPRPARWRLDFDYHVFLARRPDEAKAERVRAVYADLPRRHALGRDLDGFQVLLEDARRAACPRDPVFGHVDLDWALHRAHVLGGKRVVVEGEDPQRIVRPPTLAEMERALVATVASVRRHPQHPEYGILSACRMLYSLETSDFVVSKYACGLWAKRHADPAWGPAIDAAVRAYCRSVQRGDADLLEAAWGPVTDAAAKALRTRLGPVYEEAWANLELRGA